MEEYNISEGSESLLTHPIKIEQKASQSSEEKYDSSVALTGGISPHKITNPSETIDEEMPETKEVETNKNDKKEYKYRES